MPCSRLFRRNGSYGSEVATFESGDEIHCDRDARTMCFKGHHGTMLLLDGEDSLCFENISLSDMEKIIHLISGITLCAYAG